MVSASREEKMARPAYLDNILGTKYTGPVDELRRLKMNYDPSYSKLRKDKSRNNDTFLDTKLANNVKMITSPVWVPFFIGYTMLKQGFIAYQMIKGLRNHKWTPKDVLETHKTFKMPSTLDYPFHQRNALSLLSSEPERMNGYLAHRLKKFRGKSMDGIAKKMAYNLISGYKNNTLPKRNSFFA